MDWVTIVVYLLLIVFGWFSVCGASYDYGDRDFLDFSTRAGKQFVWIICSFGLGFVLLNVFLTAVAASLVNPRKDALLQLNLEPQVPARLNAHRRAKGQPPLVLRLVLIGGGLDVDLIAGQSGGQPGVLAGPTVPRAPREPLP